MGATEQPSLVLGTAGHIDHGKSSLIRALTGTDPDRLKEEKERGITIELGFARLDLPSGRSMGVVDVPGHERFVRQMVAGATGVDVVLLVVAADDGVMPQTREHLAIIDLLGIERGVVALTKADLVDEDWLALVAADVESLISTTSIAGTPVVAVSSATGQGLAELLAALDSVADTTPSRHASLPMRLPVDRVFTIAGAGTVVTGTMWSGTASRDDAVEVFPGGQTGRLRGVQVHSESVESAHAGQRVALNVAGVDRDQIHRGDVIAAPGTLTVTDRFDAHFTYLGVPGSDKEFESDTRVHVNHGTREVLGRVLLMGTRSLAPGESAFAQVRLEESLAPRFDDRFIIRSYSPVYTVGGGVVLDALPPRRTTLRPEEGALLEALLAHDLSSASVGLLTSRGLPMTSAEVAAALGVARAQVADELNKAGLERVKVGNETAFVAREALEALVRAIERELLDFHEEHPTATGISTSALRDRVDRRIPSRAFDAVVERAVAEGSVVAEKGQVRHAKAAVSALAQAREIRDAVVPLVSAGGLTPPTVAELATTLGQDQGLVRKALSTLGDEGEVVRVSSDLHFSVPAIGQAQSAVTRVLEDNPDGATAAQLREVLGVSRKFAIPLLEYFDAQGMTKRVGELRTLRR
jgi:selenocysteine-specific elongation factor